MADNPINSLLDQRPITGLHFRVSIADMAGAASMLTGGIGGTKFSSIQGLSVTAITVKDESQPKDEEPHFINKIEYGNLTLTRGVTPDITAFTIWCTQIFTQFAKSQTNPLDLASKGTSSFASKALGGMTAKVKNLVITLMNEKGIPIMAWAVKEAVPISWSFNGFDAMTPKVLMEEIVLKHKGFEVIPIVGADLI